MDFEAWERDHTVVTEFGWSATHWQDGQEVSEMAHLIVKEHRPYVNGTYVEQHRDVRYPCYASRVHT